MSISLEEVRRIALLARLELEPEEEQRYGAQLQQIVGYIDQLAELEAGGESTPTEGPGSLSGDGVADEPREWEMTERFLANAPEILDRYLKVPQVKSSDG